MSRNKETNKMTLGEQRVHLNFNPSSDDKIGTFKRMMANAIDYLNNEMSIKTTDAVSHEEYLEIREINRCLEKAMTDLETAQMYGVKAIAKKL